MNDSVLPAPAVATKEGWTEPQAGVSIRDILACAAMHAIVTARANQNMHHSAISQRASFDLGKVAYDAADSMMKARNAGR